MEVWSAAVSFKPTVLDPEGRVAKLGQFFRVSSCILVKHTVPNEITTLKTKEKRNQFSAIPNLCLNVGGEK